jgi:hypothetical protein
VRDLRKAIATISAGLKYASRFRTALLQCRREIGDGG